MLCKMYRPGTSNIFIWIGMKILIFWSSYMTNYKKKKEKKKRGILAWLKSSHGFIYMK